MISKRHRSDTFVGDFDNGSEYLIRLFSDDDNWVDFQIFAVACTTSEGKLYSGANHPVPLDHEEVEAVAEGFVKWDGCTQFTMDAHVDDRDDLDTMLHAVKEARRLAAVLMGDAYNRPEYD